MNPATCSTLFLRPFPCSLELKETHRKDTIGTKSLGIPPIPVPSYFTDASFLGSQLEYTPHICLFVLLPDLV